jgi:hypothetical protein
VRTLRLPGKRVRYALLALVVCGYLAARIDTGADTTSDWRHQTSDLAKRFATNMQSDAALLERSGASLATIDDQTPAYLIAPSHKPWNRLERLVPAIAPQLHVVAAGPHPLQVRQDGEVIPIDLQELATGRSAVPGAGAVELSGGSRVGAACAATGSQPAALSFRSEELVEGQSLFGRVAYDVRRRSAQPALVSAPGSYRAREVRLPLDRARGQLYLNLGHRLNATLPPHVKVCLRSAGVGWIRP